MSLEVVVQREEGVSHLTYLSEMYSPLLSLDQSIVSLKESIECRSRVLEVGVALMTYHQVNKSCQIRILRLLREFRRPKRAKVNCWSAV